jgi:hypothetical protein
VKFNVHLNRKAEPVVEEDVEKLIVSCKCGARWTGTKPGHCSLCHQTFGAETSWEGHKYGPFDPINGNRDCHTSEWMTNKGWWQDDAGIWRLPKADGNPFADKE